MADVYRIHPAIGIARVGNSPTDFFVGPERVGEQPNPPGGFKDAQCRVKRQAARFRIFVEHDDGTFDEITEADADIVWTVHLVNSKAANSGRGNSGSASDLTIDPGPRTLNGPNQRQLFDTGTIKFSSAAATTVPLGEIRTDHDGHLLVLGGFGTSASPPGTALSGYFWSSPEWYDDISDGPVSASITLHSDSSTPAVSSAWVICAPPKFAPHQDSTITLYDRLLEVMVDGGLSATPTHTSYTNDVFPILQRSRDTRWVVVIPPGVMAWPDPVMSDPLRNAIFGSLRIPGGGGTAANDMPAINPSSPPDNTSDRLTKYQYAHMQRWRDNNPASFTNDWIGPPVAQAGITPDGLDRAALEACVGGAFYPGIEAGGLPGARPIMELANYAEAFRLQPALAPGAITNAMALPWQNDFVQCADNWWPVPRPEYVTRGGASNQNWTAGVVGNGPQMVANWHRLGFVVQQGAQHVEVARCDTASIDLITPLLNFQDVPQGPMGMVHEVPLAITFEVISPSSAVTLQYALGGAPSHPQLTPHNSSDTVGPTPTNGVATARLWVIYRTSNVGDVMPPQVVTVQDAAGTQNWTVTIIGNTVARKTAEAALILDCSGSMSEDRGDGQSKHASLQQAASIFVSTMLEGDGVGLVRFNQDAQVLQPVVQLGDGGLSDTNRGDTIDLINGNALDPNGNTSIGNGIFAGRGVLNASAVPFDTHSLVVLTDGMENSPLMIADVAAQINEFTYAVGLGQPQNISVPALQTISGNNGGYLLVTGSIGTDNRFLLEKYFLQILAGISNAEIVLDPVGQLIAGRVERVPFQLTAGDAGVDVILLSPYVSIIDFRLQAPSGQIIEPWRARSSEGMRYVLANGVSYYRLTLPTELVTDRFDGGGTWNALLTIGRPRFERSDSQDGSDQTILRRTSVPAATSARQRVAHTQRASMIVAEQLAESARAGIGASDSIVSGQRVLPYSVVVHAYSNLSLQAHVVQASFEPGTSVDVYASIAQSGIPVAQRAHLSIDITRTDGSVSTIAMTAREDGQFFATFATSAPGVYRFRIRARGTTQRGEPFTREKTLTAAVWRGDKHASGSQGSEGQLLILCKLMKCLLGREGVLNAEMEKQLEARGINIASARACMDKLCREQSTTAR